MLLLCYSFIHVPPQRRIHMHENCAINQRTVLPLLQVLHTYAMLHTERADTQWSETVASVWNPHYERGRGAEDGRSCAAIPEKRRFQHVHIEYIHTCTQSIVINQVLHTKVKHKHTTISTNTHTYFSLLVIAAERPILHSSSAQQERKRPEHTPPERWIHSLKRRLKLFVRCIVMRLVFVCANICMHSNNWCLNCIYNKQNKPKRTPNPRLLVRGKTVVEWALVYRETAWHTPASITEKWFREVVSRGRFERGRFERERGRFEREVVSREREREERERERGRFEREREREREREIDR